MNHEDYALYIEEPLTPYRKSIFSKLIRNISGGDVCDLGSHAVGHYWALGYAERIDTIAFYDVSERALELQQRTLDILSPAMIEERYGDTMKFLRDENISNVDISTLALSLQEKIIQLKKFNFLEDRPNKKFDFLIAIESLEIVKTIEEYRIVFQKAWQLLRPSTGILLAVVVPYVAHNDNVACLCQSGLEALLNPSHEDTKAALNQAGFKDVSFERVETYMENYPDAYFITACR